MPLIMLEENGPQKGKRIAVAKATILAMGMKRQ